MSEYAKDFLRSTFPPKTMNAICAAVQRGINAASTVSKSVDFLRTPLGASKIPHLRECAVQHALGIAAEQGLIPFAATYASNGKNHHHLELRDEEKDVVITVSQVPSPESPPRAAIHRRNLSMRNDEITFFELRPDLFPTPPHEAGYYCIIAFSTLGAEQEFVYAGIPDLDNKKWLDKIPLIGTVVVADSEDTDFDEEIRRRLMEENKGALLNENTEKHVGNTSDA